MVNRFSRTQLLLGKEGMNGEAEKLVTVSIY